MKDGILVSTAEKTFLLQAVNENLRLDDRQLNEHRHETICFGTEWGSCLVTLGETRVLAQVSCDIQQPKASKPNEGLLYVHVEMSPMAALHFESVRQSDISVQVNRLLEKCLKESKCVDLEALCIVADEKVWNIRIDLNVMNYEGNLAGCCSIAALAALAHFKHPDVTSTGEQIIIHSFSEKEPVPITLHHYPVIISYALFNSGKQILTDPTALEESVADSLLLLSVNSYHEICGMHLEGTPLPSSDVILKSTKNAIRVADHLVKQIKLALAADKEKRSQKPFNGLTDSLHLDHILARVQENLNIKLKSERTWRDETGDSIGKSLSSEVGNSVRRIPAGMEVDEDSNGEEEEEPSADIKLEKTSDDECEADSKYLIKSVAERTAELEAKAENLAMYEDDSSENDDIEVIHAKEFDQVEIQLSDDSEEDEVVVLKSSYK